MSFKPSVNCNAVTLTNDFYQNQVPVKITAHVTDPTDPDPHKSGSRRRTRRSLPSISPNDATTQIDAAAPTPAAPTPAAPTPAAPTPAAPTPAAPTPAAPTPAAPTPTAPTPTAPTPAAPTPAAPTPAAPTPAAPTLLSPPHTTRSLMDLPNELLQAILVRVPGRAVGQVSRVCAAFYHFYQESWVWKDLCRNELGLEVGFRFA